MHGDVVRRVRPPAGQRVEAGVVRPAQYGAGGGDHFTAREAERYNTLQPKQILYKDKYGEKKIRVLRADFGSLSKDNGQIRREKNKGTARLC
jgi:hypothetical protein